MAPVDQATLPTVKEALFVGFQLFGTLHHKR